MDTMRHFLVMYVLLVLVCWSIVKGTEIELYLNDIDLIDGGDGGDHDGEVLVMDGSHALKKEMVDVYNDYQKVNGLKTKTK